MRRKGATGTISYDVGGSNGHIPVTVTLSDTRDFTVRSVAGKHPHTTGNVSGMYWTLTAGVGIKTPIVRFTYLHADKIGSEAAYRLGRYSSGWSLPGATYDTAANQVTVIGVTAFSDWVLGEPGSFLMTSGEGTPAESGVPKECSLEHNFPNPFNRATQIEFSMAQAGHVELQVIDALGRVVARPVSGYHPAGTFSVTWDATGDPSGVYFPRMNGGTLTATRKMILVR